MSSASSANPWLPAAERPEPDRPRAGEEVRARRWASGAEVRVRDGRALGTFGAPGGGLWVVGAHGGAGASVLACLLGAEDAGVAWPVPGAGDEEVRVLVAARTSAHGIEAAQDAAVQWASGALEGVDLVGVVWVADAPGRLPRELRRLVALVSGAFPMSVSVPWVGAWRTAAVVDAAAAPKDVRRALSRCRLPERKSSP